jgi:hypothetical protein
MILANIVSSSKIEVPEEFNVVKSINSVIDGLPTLIIGYDLVNKHYPDFDITNIEIEPNLFWTFKRTEKRDKYEEDLNWFIKKVYEDLTNKLVYVFVDPIQYKPRTLKKIVKKIYSLRNPIVYQHKDMIYIYGENIIFGVDLKLLSFVGLNQNKIKEKINYLSDTFLTENQILIEYQNYIDILNNKVRYIPYLYSIKNEQNDTSSIIHIPREG